VLNLVLSGPNLNRRSRFSHYRSPRTYSPANLRPMQNLELSRYER
jgi:hypothetical protein